MPYFTTTNTFRFILVLLSFISLAVCDSVENSALPVNEVPTASSVNITDANGGDAVVNDRLIGNYIYADAEDDAEGASIYRWFRDGAVIGGATASDYILVAADIGKSIIFEVTPVAISGSITGTLTGTAIASVAFVPNSSPIANAGPDQSALFGETVTLNGSGSSDVNGNLLTYNWSFISRPPLSTATLSDPTAVGPSFDIFVSGDYVVQLIVNDGMIDSVSNTVIISTDNSAPVANAGPGQSALFGETVTLNGSGSSDVDGDGLTYSWLFTSKPALSTATLTGPTTVNPTFDIDVSGDYVVQLIVNDGTVDSDPDTVTISTNNTAPVANAGLDQSAFLTDTVTLNGSGSSDVDGDLLTYSWSITLKPEGSTAELSDPAAVGPTFVVDLHGDYVAQLIVNDSTVDSVPVTVTISTTNSAPVADAGADQAALNGDTVILDGTGSSDVDGDMLTYSWSFTTRPTGSGATLTGPTTEMPTFDIDVTGEYVAQLIVKDGTLDSAPDTVTISTTNSAPVADAGVDDQAPLVNDTVTLDGTGSSDADGDDLTFSWSFTSKPTDSTATLSNATAVSPTFVVDLPGEYVAQLIVNDGTVDSAPVTVTINTSNSAPVADAVVNDQAPLVGNTVTLDGSGSSDVDIDPLTYIWSLTVPTGSLATLSDPTAISPTFVVDLPGTYEVQLIVNDGTVNSAPDTVTISTSNSAPVADAGGPYTVDEGAIVSLDANGSSDPDGDALSYAWDLDNDGAFDDAVGAIAAFSRNDNGSFNVAVKVSDGLLSSIATAVVTVNNVVPTVNAGVDQSVNTGVSVSFTGTFSDPGADTHTEQWNFGDGSPVVSGTLTPSHTYAAAGTYTVTLTVTDDDGGVGSDTLIVTVSNVNVAPVADAGGPYTVDEGASVSLDASGSSDPDGDLLSYAWDLDNDGAFDDAVGAIAAFSRNDNGSFNVAVKVSDGLLSSIATAVVTVNNVVPTVNAGVDQSVNTGVSVSFTGTFSDPGADTHTEQWNFGDGSPVVSGTLTPSHTYAAAGTYTVTLTVTDDDGGVGSDTLIVTVSNVNVAPVANAGGPYTVDEGAIVSLDASGSSDPDGDALSYAWDLDNDGAFDDAVGAIVAFSRNDNGSFNVAVEVSDGLLSSIATAVVTVNDLGPTAVLSGDSILTEGQLGSYDASSSTSSPDAIVLYEWNFGDGSPLESGITLLTPTHAYADNGTYTVTLTVTDDDGSTDAASMLVTVSNVVPTVNAGVDQSVNTGVSVSFTGTFNDPGTLDTHTVEWNFGDGSPVVSGTLTPSHAYAAAGAYTVTLTVTDDDGGVGSDTLIVTVN